MNREAWSDGFNNLWMSLVDGVQAVLPSMREKRWSCILAVTSVATHREPAALISSVNP